MLVNYVCSSALSSSEWFVRLSMWDFRVPLSRGKWFGSGSLKGAEPAQSTGVSGPVLIF